MGQRMGQWEMLRIRRHHLYPCFFMEHSSGDHHGFCCGRSRDPYRDGHGPQCEAVARNPLSAAVAVVPAAPVAAILILGPMLQWQQLPIQWCQLKAHWDTRWWTPWIPTLTTRTDRRKLW